MAHRGAGTLLRLAGFEGDNRLFEIASLGGGAGECGHILQAFYMEADGGDARVFGQSLNHAGDIHIRLIAHGEDGG